MVLPAAGWGGVHVQLRTGVPQGCTMACQCCGRFLYSDYNTSLRLWIALARAQ